MLDLVSVIVPVYNVEKCLSRCVNSLLNQTYHNLEIILVDDGSPDNCGKICDNYAARDSRVRVIHKKNGGLSDARNAAIPLVQGVYISFVDSDDWVSERYIEHLYEAIKKDNSDLAFSWFTNVFEGQEQDVSKYCVPEKNDVENYSLLNSHDCLKKMFYQNGVECCAWGKLYKKEIISDLRYPIGKLYEDIPVTYESIKRAKKIAVISNVDYFYLQRAASIQYQKFDLRKLDGIKHCRDMMEAVKKDYQDLGPAAECRYLSTVCNIFFQINEKKYEKEKRKLWREIKKYRKSVLTNPEARKKARMGALVSYGGSWFMRTLYKATQPRGMVSNKR